MTTLTKKLNRYIVNDAN